MSTVFVRTIGHELVGHDYLKIPVKNKHHCLAYCQRDPSCFSVNVAVSDIISEGHGLCTLNNKDDFDRPNHMTVHLDINYYRKVSVLNKNVQKLPFILNCVPKKEKKI